MTVVLKRRAVCSSLSMGPEMPALRCGPSAGFAVATMVAGRSPGARLPGARRNGSDAAPGVSLFPDTATSDGPRMALTGMTVDRCVSGYDDNLRRHVWMQAAEVVVRAR